MIVYNVKRTWFTMKADAEAYRKREGLKPDAVFPIRVDTREELAALLNGLCGIGTLDVLQGNGRVIPGPSLLPERVAKHAAVLDDNAIPDCVPQFLRDSWAKRMRGES